MRYTLTLTLRPDAPVPKEMPLCEKSLRLSQKLAIGVNYYNLTVRVVNLTGEQLEIFDAFHNADEFVSAYIYRGHREPGYGEPMNSDSSKYRSGFCIGLSDHYIRSQIQCEGDPENETGAMAFETLVQNEAQEIMNGDKSLSDKKNYLSRRTWIHRVVKPIHVVPFGQTAPLEDLPLGRVDLNISPGSVFFANKTVGIFDAKSPQDYRRENIINTNSADEIMWHFQEFISTHSVSTQSRKDSQWKKNLHHSQSTYYCHRKFSSEEVDRLSADEFMSAIIRMNEDPERTLNNISMYEKSAFFKRGMQLLNPADQDKYLHSSRIFSDYQQYSKDFGRSAEPKPLSERVPTLVGFSYPAHGALISLRKTTAKNSITDNKLVPAACIQILPTEEYQKALEGRLEPLPSYAAEAENPQKKARSIMVSNPDTGSSKVMRMPTEMIQKIHTNLGLDAPAPQVIKPIPKPAVALPETPSEAEWHVNAALAKVQSHALPANQYDNDDLAALLDEFEPPAKVPKLKHWPDQYDGDQEPDFDTIIGTLLGDQHEDGVQPPLTA